jgi:hypothetical protein
MQYVRTGATLPYPRTCRAKLDNCFSPHLTQNVYVSALFLPSLQFYHLEPEVFPINRAEYPLKMYKTPKYLTSFSSQIFALTCFNPGNITQCFSNFKRTQFERD